MDNNLQLRDQDMTEHIRQEDTEADKTAMRHLAIVIGLFVAATIVLATTVGLIMG